MIDSILDLLKYFTLGILCGFGLRHIFSSIHKKLESKQDE